MNLTQEEQRLTLRAISNQIDHYSAAIKRTLSFNEPRLRQLEEEKSSLITAYHKIKNHEPALTTPTT